MCLAIGGDWCGTMTDNDQQVLIETLQFTPRIIRVSLWGYGGEIVVGSISEQCYRHWVEQDEEQLAEFVWGDNDQGVPHHARFVDPGSWYDCDDVLHENGVELESCSGMTVVDESTGQTLLEIIGLDLDNLRQFGITTDCVDEFYASACDADRKFFLGLSIEKGLFYEGQCRITRPFDPGLITLPYREVEGTTRCCSVFYDGEEIQDLGAGDTNGKDTHFAVLSAT